MHIIIEQKILSEILKYPEIKIGYHGAPYKFDKFYDRVTYFANTPDFATGYAIAKSQDREMDADIYLYSADLSGINFFNASKKEHLNKLIEVLPDKVNIVTTWGPYKAPKEEVIDGLKGVAHYKGLDPKEWKGKQRGDTMKYEGENVLILDIKDDYVYFIPLKHINWAVEYSTTPKKRPEIRLNREYGKFRENIFKELDEYYDMLAQKYKQSRFDNRFFYHATEGERKKAYEMINNGKQQLIDNIENYPFLAKRIQKKNLKLVKEDVDTNYEFFESIMEFIQALGFEGHIASERFSGNTAFTYAVYDPSGLKILERKRIR